MLRTATPTFSVSPRIGVLLSQVTDTPDIETALMKVLTEYLDLKIEQLQQRIRSYEAKWQMSFVEFAERSEKGTLAQDPFSYPVESDFWEWEEAETLLKHYETLQTRWI